MTPFLSSLFANLAIAFVLVVVILGLKNFQTYLTKHIKGLTAFTVGILLYLIFIDFIPELNEEISGVELGSYLLLGIGIFYVLELIFHWHHCGDLGHEKDCQHGFHEKHKEHQNLMFTGTFLHNAFHGIELFSAFVISMELGIALTIGIALHALPQNIANFIMNHHNIRSVILAATGGVGGALLIYPFGGFITEHAFVILAITAGGLTYLALTDILPSLHGGAKMKEKTSYFVMVLLGIAMMYLVRMLMASAGIEA